MHFRNPADTITAPSTATGEGALAVIRLSGKDAITICNECFPATDLTKKPTHTLHFGTICTGETVIDEVVVSLFRSPKSYTGEDVVEVSCHGSTFIINEILNLFQVKGARMAHPGEFTLRAFLNGKMDLSQAEAVADLIASDSGASHALALKQMRGGYSAMIKQLRDKLIDFASLIELELDFSEEDVEFADRSQLKKLIIEIQERSSELIRSFQLGNVLKKGVPVVIAGKPNVGKSTLLNLLLNEERAIVSETAGTTRDTIEDEMVIEGIRFRFIDTAGIRQTHDEIEAIGVNRTLDKLKESAVVLYVFDASQTKLAELEHSLSGIREHSGKVSAHIIAVANKSDLANETEIIREFETIGNLVYLSAKMGTHIDELKKHLLATVHAEKLNSGDTIVTNARHAEALQGSFNALDRVLKGLDTGLSGDLLSVDIRQALYFLGSITGEISTDDLLENIFSKFCIGK